MSYVQRILLQSGLAIDMYICIIKSSTCPSRCTSRKRLNIFNDCFLLYDKILVGSPKISVNWIFFKKFEQKNSTLKVITVCLYQWVSTSAVSKTHKTVLQFITKKVWRRGCKWCGVLWVSCKLTILITKVTNSTQHLLLRGMCGHLFIFED